MKKNYISPCLNVVCVASVEMLAASLPIGKGTVSGGDALGKENNWDIFGTEDDAEAEDE